MYHLKIIQMLCKYKWQLVSVCWFNRVNVCRMLPTVFIQKPLGTFGLLHRCIRKITTFYIAFQSVGRCNSWCKMIGLVRRFYRLWWCETSAANHLFLLKNPFTQLSDHLIFYRKKTEIKWDILDSQDSKKWPYLL